MDRWVGLIKGGRVFQPAMPGTGKSPLLFADRNVRAPFQVLLQFLDGLHVLTTGGAGIVEEDDHQAVEGIDLALFEDVLRVEGDVLPGGLEKFGDFGLGEPRRPALDAEVKAGEAVVGGVEDKIAHELSPSYLLLPKTVW